MKMRYQYEIEGGGDESGGGTERVHYSKVLDLRVTYQQPKNTYPHSTGNKCPGLLSACFDLQIGHRWIVSNSINKTLINKTPKHNSIAG